MSNHLSIHQSVNLNRKKKTRQATSSTCFSGTILLSARKEFATAKRACSGHGKNQFITVLFTIPGKFRHLVRKKNFNEDFKDLFHDYLIRNDSPTGDIARTI